MVASAGFRGLVAAQPDETLAGLDLTGRERRRLVSMARQRGMAVSTAIHRANRLLPLDHTLPFTCFLLGDQLREVVDQYWRENPAENLQLPAECERFAAFLAVDLASGRVSGPYLEEVLAFERAATELRFFTEDELRRRAGVERDLPPLVRIVRFRHDPVPLLEALSRRQLPPPNLQHGEFHLLIDCRSGEPEFRLLDAQAAAAVHKL